MRALAILVVLLGASHARADSVAFTCRGAPNVKPITQNGACIGFIASDASGKQVQRVDKGYQISGSIHATPDGTTVAMLHGFPYTNKPFETQPALIFFRGGKEVATYSMTDLVQRMNLVTRSTSHHRWLVTSPELELGKTLELTTTSQRVYRFDVATGKQTAAGDTADWKDCELIVYLGERVPPPTNDLYVIAKPWVAKGTLTGPLSVRAMGSVRIDSGKTICVMPTKSGWHATKNLDVMFNLLPK
jgi:hypothetical protein